MAIVKRYDGNVVIIPAPADTAVRDVIEFGTNYVGVAQTAGKAGEDISVELVGVYEFPADTTEAFAVGDVAKWDSASGTMISTGATTAGLILSAKAGGVAGTILVKIGV
jgi:predicted RecA/RadA family phage recombinase